jgi:hypothetical protein
VDDLTQKWLIEYLEEIQNLLELGYSPAAISYEIDILKEEILK